MIILRNKLYTSSEDTKGKDLKSSSGDETLSGVNISSASPPYKSPLQDNSNPNPDISGVTQGIKQTGRLSRVVEKVMSDTPMGITYVGQSKKKKKKHSWFAKRLRKHSAPILDKSEETLKKLPMSEESMNRQRRKLDAIDFWINKGADGLDYMADKVYSESRMPVSSTDMRKAETDGVVQRRPDGKWGIIAKKKRLWWSAGYDSKESAEAALRAYHAGKH